MSQDEAMSNSMVQPIQRHDSSSRMSSRHGSPEPQAILPAKRKRLLSQVEITNVVNHDDYEALPGGKIIHRILEETNLDDEISFRVQFGDFHEEMIPFEKLIQLPNGSSALTKYNERHTRYGSVSSGEDSINYKMVSTRATSRRTSRSIETVDSATSESISDNDAHAERLTFRKRQQAAKRVARFKPRRKVDTGSDVSQSSESEDELGSRTRLRPRKPVNHGIFKTRAQRTQRKSYGYDVVKSSSSGSEGSSLTSDVKSKRRARKSRHDDYKAPNFSRFAYGGTSRQSDRRTRNQRNMEEIGIDHLYRSESETRARSPQLKVSGAREVFKTLVPGDSFRDRHCQYCDTCGKSSDASQLVYCQGCCLSYHRGCLGTRSVRDHLVTKINESDFVLQCRRCVNTARKREPKAPDHSICQTCKNINDSCTPFRERKTPQQEQREREDNGGEDPTSEVNPSLLYNVNNLLFRCMKCWRAFHFHHLPSRNPNQMDFDDEKTTADSRYEEYCHDWICKDCVEMPGKITGLIAWRPRNKDTYISGFSADMVEEDDKEYLVKWENLSYFRARWMPGAWTWGLTAAVMRKAFLKKDNGPKMHTEDAIPEDYLRIDIVLDVRFTSIVDIRNEEVDKARIKEVDEALLKFKGLGYEDVVWEKVPSPEDGDRWTDFVTAYYDWVMGRYIHAPKQSPLRVRLEKARALPFTKLEKTKQPANLTGGELMKYQIDGLNWLYYRWYLQKNAILADEMGLGKTIQIIGLLATLVQDHTCFPFLLVVPNATCPNWRREIKRWAPSLRVVAYYGSSAGRKLAYEHELYPEGSKDLRCHVVVTSYDAAADDSCARFFRRVSWAGLVVDEGQRLKNDSSLLYEALNMLKVPFKILLTGTPLQNNTRELFNLLQFLDTSVNAATLEEEYAELTEDKVRDLHNRIRPYFLRRTKAQVLSFLPPIAQIIVPVSMSLLQKKLYMSILAKNPELLRSIFSTDRALKPSERSNLSNIVMQLRKCLCHPFVYSQEIEERTDIAAVSHRNLVDASSKLKLLELLLPKLQEQGHRVLIFSQFLDMLSIVEDFLDGLGMQYQRLDGTMSAMQKQKRIDEFNAPESPLFAFLLSTRAGGVGINLATADTVIILDPDFNPHQDIQALSRAHRIGQKKKVLCYQLMTRASVEEKIMQIGRKKMALDHVVVEQMGAEEEDELEIESILQYGAAELFDDKSESKDIHYDEASVDKLLDRSQVENTKAGEDNSAESQFSFARVWANDQETLQDTIGETDERKVPDPTVWDRILKERERAAAEAAAARAVVLGRGKRARTTVDYGDVTHEAFDSPQKPQRRKSNESDTDFSGNGNDKDDQTSGGESDEEEEKQKANLMPFKRVKVVKPISQYAEDPSSGTVAARWLCPACHNAHPIGSCPLKIAGVERCNLCGIAHYGQARSCPHINSEEKVRAMIEALKHSSESRHLVESASKYLKGVKGHLVAKNKKDAERASVATRGPGLGVGPGPGPEVRTNGHVVPSRQGAPPSPWPQWEMHANSMNNGPTAMNGVAQGTVSAYPQDWNHEQPANLTQSIPTMTAGAAVARMTVPSNAANVNGNGNPGNQSPYAAIDQATLSRHHHQLLQQQQQQQ